MDQLAPGGVYPVQLGRSEVVLLPDGDVEALVPEAGIFAVPPPIPPHRDVLVIPGMGAKKTCARATAGSMSEGASRRAKRCEGARAAAESTGDGGSRRAKRCAGVDDGRWEHVYRSGRGVFFGFFWGAAVSARAGMTVRCGFPANGASRFSPADPEPLVGIAAVWPLGPGSGAVTREPCTGHREVVGIR